MHHLLTLAPMAILVVIVLIICRKPFLITLTYKTSALMTKVACSLTISLNRKVNENTLPWHLIEVILRGVHAFIAVLIKRNEGEILLSALTSFVPIRQ
uniref:Uncharacterized protein n=1 Tax=Glossina brevipalpis TaxID=37001 RepID=A0A1A9W263_9MUSC